LSWATIEEKTASKLKTRREEGKWLKQRNRHRQDQNMGRSWALASPQCIKCQGFKLHYSTGIFNWYLPTSTPPFLPTSNSTTSSSGKLFFFLPCRRKGKRKCQSQCCSCWDQTQKCLIISSSQPQSRGEGWESKRK
jgi:hypothetical protein